MKYLLRGDDSQLYTVTRDDIYRLVCTPDMSEEDQELTILNWIESEDAQAFSDETFNDYQEATLETAKYPPNKALEYLSLGIASEAGEVAGKMKKWIRDGDSKMTDAEWKQAMASEIGDVLWYCARLAAELDLSLSQIAEDNMEKLLGRKERGVIGGSGDNR
jgi:NTP pyrophosphatase (non-canonical NTP hydrolase)